MEAKVLRGVASGAWKGIRDIQRGRAGLHPTRSKSIKTLDGQLCLTPAESL